ncbi:3-deoxy-D-manno-octulosonic acid transferase [Rickettsiales bacterium]|nr:3-deoxy-D-manno-octulosonic acid transferase [Rickettsiales bacterium]
MLLKLYQIMTSLAAPLIGLYLLHRKKLGKEDPLRFRERLGKASVPRPNNKPLLWIHAASVGESLSVMPVINKISQTYPNITILLTTGTVSSAKMVESRLPDNAFHQYVPIDRILIIRRFLNYWRPNLAIWVESELWPNLVTETGKYCPMILLNGRISDSSFKKWKRYYSLGKHILSRFSLSLAQSKHDAARLEELGARNVKYIGNLKFDSAALPADPKKMGDMVAPIGERPVWLAASTHAGEEEMVAAVHKQLKEKHPDLLTIIAPRHPQRSNEILDMLTDLGLSVSRRSFEQTIKDETDIYLADTLGEMGIFYRLVPTVFIGGSLVEHGGQNPLEAARLECAIVFGPYMDNFAEIRNELLNNNAALKVRNEDELRDAIDELIVDHDKHDQLASAALDLMDSKIGVLDKTMEELASHIEKIIPGS